MSKIVETYPDVDSLQAQVETRQKFGWKYSINITDRAVYEVTFTRDDSIPRNQKLGALEDDFDACCNAEDYIERFARVRANKKQFRALHPVMWLVVGYVLFMCLAMAVVMCGFKLIHVTNPNAFYEIGIEFTGPGGESTPLSPGWSEELNFEELGIKELLETFGIHQESITVTVDLIVNILFGFGIAGAAIALIIIIFIIRRSIRAKRYYKADVEYINRRRELLNSKIDEIEQEMDDIIAQVNAL